MTCLIVYSLYRHAHSPSSRKRNKMLTHDMRDETQYVRTVVRM